MKPFVVAVVTALVFAFSAKSAAQDCTRDEAYAAETVTDYLNSWENVSLFFKQFRHCYDGGIAEGVQDKIQILWADRWQELPRMLALTKNDPDFKAFLWQVLESEAFPQDRFSKLVQNAERRCPLGAKEFCVAVKRAAAVGRGA